MHKEKRYGWNLKAFEKWWYSDDGDGDDDDRVSQYCGHPVPLRDFMLFVKANALKVFEKKVSALSLKQVRAYDKTTTAADIKEWLLIAFKHDGSKTGNQKPSLNVPQNYFARFENLAWHYDGKESQTQNLRTFEKWWCYTAAIKVTSTGEIARGPADASFCRSDYSNINNNKNHDLEVLMRFYEKNREKIIWDFAYQHSSPIGHIEHPTDAHLLRGAFYGAFRA
ncbi:hypothetical protein [Candidatus Nitrososphaera evergladensis]|uniref:hypothetical protein n=1 Tax=Candidatus Nitrososphaera evergladensis TaxID=1459637 RepID=UPI001D05510E|nr:hypothetical protein [Candidatus Nitrososphaera evergladensis]